MLGELLTLDSRVAGPVIGSLTEALYSPVAWVAVGGLVVFGMIVGRLR